MNLLAFLVIFGVASASFPEELDDAANVQLLDFLEGMGRAPSLSEHFGGADFEYSEESEDEIKTEIGKQLKRSLSDILERIKVVVVEGKLVREEFFEKLKRTVRSEHLKEKFEKIFGQVSALLDRWSQSFREKGRKKVDLLIDLLLNEDDREGRSISDYWDKIKNYFKDLKIDLQEKYMKFGEWVKEVVGKGMEHSKDKMENIHALAKEFVKHAKGISKEVAVEAGEFFRNYKEELGNVWEEIKERINEIKNRKE